MDAKIWAALISGIATVFGVAVGLVGAHLKERANRRSQAVSNAKTAVQELLKAAFDTKSALAVWEAQWRDPRKIAATIGRAAAQVVAGFRDDRIYHGAAEGIGSALAWRQASDAAEEALITGPLSRMAAAAAQIAMLNDAELREAATELTSALGTLVASYGEGRKSRTRAAADSEVDEAIGRLSSAARAYKGKKRRRAALTTA